MTKFLLGTLFLMMITGPNFLLAQNELPQSKTLEKNESGVYSYEKKFDVPDVEKAELYQRLKNYISTNLSTVQIPSYDDSHYNNINTKAIIRIDWIAMNLNNQSVDFILDIAFKDGKYKVTMNNFTYHAGNGTTGDNSIVKPFHDLKPLSRKRMERVYETFDEKFTTLLTALNTAANTSTVSKDKW